jgi:hypothetical protein
MAGLSGLRSKIWNCIYSRILREANKLEAVDTGVIRKYLPIFAELEKYHPVYGIMTIELTWHEGNPVKAIVSNTKQIVLLKEGKNV